jgi:hypothetical protein
MVQAWAPVGGGGGEPGIFRPPLLPGFFGKKSKFKNKKEIYQILIAKN